MFHTSCSVSEEIVQINSFCILRKIINVVAYGVDLGVKMSFGKCSYCLRGEFLLNTLMMVFFLHVVVYFLLYIVVAKKSNIVVVA